MVRNFIHASLASPQASPTAADVLRMSSAVNNDIDDHGSGDGPPQGGKDTARLANQPGDVEMQEVRAASEHLLSESSGGPHTLPLCWHSLPAIRPNPSRKLIVAHRTAQIFYKKPWLVVDVTFLILVTAIRPPCREVEHHSYERLL